MFPGCYGDGKPKIESCIACCEPTGRAGKGEDSIYFGDVGPFCESCKDDIQNHVESKQQDEIERLRAALAEVQQARIDAAVEGSDYKQKWNTCRALLREACEAWEGFYGTADNCLAFHKWTRNNDWHERARAAGGGE